MKFLRRLLEIAAPAAAPNLELPAEDLMTTVADDAQDRHHEKARLKAIMCCAEAVGREALANHLALETGLSVSEAKAVLLACPSETLAATQAADAFSDMMRKHPEYAVTAQEVPDPPTVIERIQANYRLASGIPAQKPNEHST